MLGGQGAIFMVSYCTLLMSFFTASTISYDEFNHWIFLSVLPSGEPEGLCGGEIFIRSVDGRRHMGSDDRHRRDLQQ